MEIILATQNNGKIKEFNELAKGTELNFIPVPNSPTFPEETGSTFFENASIKANFVFSLTGRTCLGDDSGLEVDALNGEPGIYSARYAGDNASDEENLNKLLKDMDKHNNRKANFCCAMVFIRSYEDPNPIIIERRWHGEILRKPIGSNGFGYDPIFYLKEYDCSSAQLDPKTKNKISHRGLALSDLLAEILLIE